MIFYLLIALTRSALTKLLLLVGKAFFNEKVLVDLLGLLMIPNAEFALLLVEELVEVLLVLESDVEVELGLEELSIYAD